MRCKDAKAIDMVDFLASLGHHPKWDHGNDYFYLSPLREENTASFVVKRDKNVWYDHGTGDGGDLIDFGKKFFRCNTAELLARLSEHRMDRTSLVYSKPPETQQQVEEKKIVVTDVRTLAHPTLVRYLEHTRGIPLDLAREDHKEVDFRLYGKKYTVIGFRNDRGGYSLRSEHFKGSSAPKGPTFMNRGREHLLVFEGSIDHLSQKFLNPEVSRKSNILVLNSLAFMRGCRDLMDQHEQVHLYLDNDPAGIKAAKQAITGNPGKYISHSDEYNASKDLNKWLTNIYLPKTREMETRPEIPGMKQKR